MSIPDTYYDNLRDKLKVAKIKVAEDMDTVSHSCSLNIKNYSIKL